MANEPITTLVGNLTADPELRFTPSGAAVANFTVAQTPRTKQGDEWVDGEPMFVSCSVWRDYAEHVTESLQKGQRVVVLGRLKVRKWTPRDGGDERLSVEMDVEEVGHSLRFGTARYSKSGAGQQQGSQWPQGGGQRSGQGQQQQRRQQPQNDPWATQQQDRYVGDEPPF